MSEIGRKRWGEVYKRVLVVKRDGVNLGFDGGLLPVESGDGVESPLLLASNIVGISGTKKLIFGDDTVYIRKLRHNVIEVGVPDRVVVRVLSAALYLSAIQLKGEELFVANIEALTVDCAGRVAAASLAGIHAYASEIRAEYIGADVVSAVAGTFTDVWASQVHVPTIDMKYLEVASLTACNGTFNTRVASPSVSAVSLQGCSNMMAWW